MDDLSLGGAATGIGFAWNEFSAYASDWSEHSETFKGIQDGMAKDGISVTGYNIWKGGTVNEIVPRALPILRKNSWEKWDA